MRYRLLGRSGLLVSEICLGTMTYGGKGRWAPIGQLGIADVEGQIRTAIDAGINFIDTADVYSEGVSEELVGQALKNLKLPREDVVVASKVRIRMGPGPNNVGLSRGHIMDGVNASLCRLLQAAFGQRVNLRSVGQRASYPLGLKYRSQPAQDRVVWLGNAAQTLHPVAGQGFNLALRDAWELADTLRDAPDPGSPSLLRTYASRRRVDRLGAIGFTDGLVRLFSSDNPLLTHLRGAGLQRQAACVVHLALQRAQIQLASRDRERSMRATKSGTCRIGTSRLGLCASRSRSSLAGKVTISKSSTAASERKASHAGKSRSSTAAYSVGSV